MPAPVTPSTYRSYLDDLIAHGHDVGPLRQPWKDDGGLSHISDCDLAVRRSTLNEPPTHFARCVGCRTRTNHLSIYWTRLHSRISAAIGLLDAYDTASRRLADLLDAETVSAGPDLHDAFAAYRDTLAYDHPDGELKPVDQIVDDHRSGASGWAQLFPGRTAELRPADAYFIEKLTVADTAWRALTDRRPAHELLTRAGLISPAHSSQPADPGRVAYLRNPGTYISTAGRDYDRALPHVPMDQLLCLAAELDTIAVRLGPGGIHAHFVVDYPAGRPVADHDEAAFAMHVHDAPPTCEARTSMSELALAMLRDDSDSDSDSTFAALFPAVIDAHA